jgi:long-chain fatty acid transport protein
MKTPSYGALARTTREKIRRAGAKSGSARIPHMTVDFYHQPRRTHFLKRARIIIYVSILVAALRGVAMGAALELYETGAPDLGTASAGRAAMAADASTAASNPAGMTLLDRSQLLVASGALLPSTNFDVAPQTTTKGSGGGNAGVFMPLGSFFLVYKFSERVLLGLASYSDYGLAINYGSAWVGRYYVSKTALFTGKVAPSIAYKVNDWLSVGAGFSFAVGRYTFQSRVNNALPRLGDGRMALESWDEAFGGYTGILIQPISKLRIGLTYQSPEYFKFGFKPFLTGLGPGLSAIRKRIGGTQVNVPLTEPQQVMASALYRIIPNLSLMGNVGWQNWTEFGEFPVGISARNQRTITANLHFSNTWQIAIGQQYRIAERWLWSAGFAYDSSPVSKANRTAVLPVDRQLRYGTGIQYEINRDVTAGAAWEFVDVGPAPFSNRRGPLAGTLQGHFSTNYFNFVALNVIWKF